MPLRTALGRQFIVRLLLALLLFAALSGLVSAWIYHLANRLASNQQTISAHEHYSKVISGLEQHWGREAFNFKIRLEAQGFLENAPQQTEKLMANLTAQGGSLEFPSLRIENTRGETLASFEYIGHKIPKARFLPGQETTWAMDPVHGQLFMVFRQYIWLGTENGYLTLFKPMDHALLTQYSYPFTRLSLWWQGKPVASSEGDDGLAKAAAFAKAGSHSPLARLPWSGNDPENVPQLLIESISPPLLSIADFAGPLLLSLLLFALAAWFLLGTWERRLGQRLERLARAQESVLAEPQMAAEIEDDLRAARGNGSDEISALAQSTEQLIRQATAAKPTGPDGAVPS
ncbi:MAG: Cyclic di-GMP phosphodiesterase Gmr [Proteobacteria bacterium]|nr:Cyclic di-GMP phosphodiesterase Gmr [Pseudomonadota bacterium]